MNRRDSLDGLSVDQGFSLSPPIPSKSSKYIRNIGHHPAFLSNSKRILESNIFNNSTPGPGKYAQYSSVHNPLIFPQGSNDQTYIMYENGRMLRRFQNYAVSKEEDRSPFKLNNFPGPGSYDTNITDFRKIKQKINREKNKLIVCNLTSPSIPSKNIYEDSSDDDDLSNSLILESNGKRKIRNRTKRRIDNISYDAGRFSTIDTAHNHNKYFDINSLAIDQNLISKGRIIKVINKGPK